MAIKDRVIEIAYKLKDQFTAGTKKITGSLRKVETASDKSTDKMVRNNKRAASSFGGISRATGPVKAAIIGLGAAIAGIVSSISTWTKAAATQERAEAKLAHSLKTLTGATDDQVKSLYDQAAALQETTGYGDEATISAQAMLATFKLTADQIKQLTPLLLDTVEAQRKMGNESADLESVAIALGKAFTGGIGLLSRYGITMSDAQKEAFKLADTQGKVNILVQALGENYGGLAKNAGDYDRAVRKANAAHGDYQETLGEMFTQNKAWIKLVDVITKAWKSLSKGVEGSSGEISLIVSALANTIILAASSIKAAWNGLQILFKSTALALNESTALIAIGLSKVTFGEMSRKYKKAADDMLAYSQELRDGIGEDVADLVDAGREIHGVFGEIGNEAVAAGDDLRKAGNGANAAAEGFNKAAAALRRSSEEAEEAKKGFSDLLNEISGAAEKAGVTDVFDEISKSVNAANAGDAERALQSAQKAAEYVRLLKEEGEVSEATLYSMALRIKEIGDAAADAATRDELMDYESQKRSMDELAAKKQKLSDEPIDVKVTLDTSAIDNYRPPELVIPVRYVPVEGASGGPAPGTYASPGSYDYVTPKTVDDFAREARMRGEP